MVSRGIIKYRITKAKPIPPPSIGTHRTLKFYDKVKSIEVKMKRLGMLKGKVDDTAKRETYEQWRIRVGIDKE